jgi:hypothetical protein
VHGGEAEGGVDADVFENLDDEIAAGISIAHGAFLIASFTRREDVD